MSDFSVSSPVGVQDGVATIAISGEVDIAVADHLVSEALAALDLADVQTLRVDLAAVTFLDSSGLGALVRVRNHAQEHGQDVVIAHVPGSVMKILTITGLASVLTLDSAEAGDGAGPGGSQDD